MGKKNQQPNNSYPQPLSKIQRKISAYYIYLRGLNSLRSSKVSNHPIIWEKKVGDLLIRRISPTSSLKLSGDRDNGYHKYGNAWWVNEKCPYSFQYFDLDSIYPTNYFGEGTGHPDEQIAKDLYGYMQETYKKLFNRKFNSVLELGAGRGEITQEFLNDNIDFAVVEGTTSGVEGLIQKGIPKERIVKQNLKLLKPLGRTFDLVMCTEVAEHIEPFFASKVVENCTCHGPAVWFSAANRNRRAHYHHMNEQDIKVWDNIFANMGFSIAVHLDQRHGRASRLFLSDQQKLMQ
jgi:hypothetical protein